MVHTLHRIQGKGLVGGHPKTASGRPRSVPLPDSALLVLMARQEQAEAVPSRYGAGPPPPPAP